MKFIQQNKKKIIALLILTLLSIPACYYLFQPGFFQTDDAEWMMIRSSAFHQSLRDGQFPVRFLGRLNFSYGYPVANFLYPGFLYLAEPFYLLGLDVVSTIKILLVLSLIMSAVFLFLWLARFVSVTAAFAGALIYLYLPYHLFDLYTRGSVGELLALAIVPFILWQLERRCIYGTAFGIASLILAHNTLAALFLPVIIGYAAIRTFHGEKPFFSYRFIGTSMFFGLGLAAFFWIPALYDLRFTVFSQTSVAESALYFASIPLIGSVSLAVISVSGILLITTWRKSQKIAHLTLYFFLLGGLSAFFASGASAFFWRFFPDSFIQFPFRLLSITLLACAFLTAYILQKLLRDEKQQGIVTAILLLFLLFFSSSYLKPQSFFNKEEGFYTTNEATTTVKNEYMPVWVKVLPTKRPDSKITAEGATIANIVSKSHEYTFQVNASQDTIIAVHTIYFPGWHATIDGQGTAIQYDNKYGIIEIPITRGTHDVKVYFTETPMRLFADLVSISSVLGLGTLWFVNRRRVKGK
jgi:uncharacterized membrane protein